MQDSNPESRLRIKKTVIISSWHVYSWFNLYDCYWDVISLYILPTLNICEKLFDNNNNDIPSKTLPQDRDSKGRVYIDFIRSLSCEIKIIRNVIIVTNENILMNNVKLYTSSGGSKWL